MAAAHPVARALMALRDGQPDQAAAHCRSILAKWPTDEAARLTYAAALCDLGRLCQEQGQWDTAANHYDAALRYAPDHVQAHSNMGLVCQQRGAFEFALRHFDAALERAPDNPDVHKNRAILRLLMGEFGPAFDEYEWRWRGPKTINKRRPFAQPDWDGTNLTNRRLLIWGEQGIGDEIMFASLLPETIRAAAGCVIECAARLEPVFARSFPAALVVARGTPPDIRTGPDCADVQIAAGSLCRWRRREAAAFGNPKAYLRADPDKMARCRARYAALGPGLKVGIAWQSKTPLWGLIKSAPLRHWAPILQTPGLQFVSLQYGDCDDDVATARALGATIDCDPTVDQMASLDDFAAQIAALDMVITVSNTTAHLAGALGVPCHVLLAFSPDWRWQARGDRPLWYPHQTLYRQAAPGAWEAPIAAVAARIHGYLTAVGSDGGQSHHEAVRHDHVDDP